MKTTEIVSRLIKIANALDEQSLVSEADALTRVAQKIAQTYNGSWEDLDAAGPGEGELGEDDYDLKTEVNRELNAEAYDAAMQTIEKLMPYFDSLTPEERQMLDEATAFVSASSSPSQNLDLSSFTNALSAGGADVYDPFENE